MPCLSCLTEPTIKAILAICVYLRRDVVIIIIIIIKVNGFQRMDFRESANILYYGTIGRIIKAFL
jgi:hypothetical protein